MRMLRRSACISAALALAIPAGAWAAPPKSPNAGGSLDPAIDAPAAATNPPYDLIFTPITPCRAFYTPSAVAATTTRNFQVTGTGNFSGQGGPTTGCGVPASAKAVAVNLSAVNPAGNGSFKAFAAGGALPPTTVLNYRSAINETGGATIALSGGGQMSVFTTTSSRIIGDITGYFAPQIHAVINSDGTIYSGSERVLESTRLSAGSYRVLIDRNPVTCTPIASIFGSAYFASSYVSGGYIYANTYNPSGTPVDLYWTLSVHC